MSETKFPTNKINIKGKNLKTSPETEISAKKAGKTSPGKERKNTHPKKWISPKKNLKNLTRKRDLTKKN